MKIKFESIYPGHAWINVNGKRVGELSRQSYGRNLWRVDINGVRKLDKSGYDCFSFVIAKQVAKYHLENLES